MHHRLFAILAGCACLAWSAASAATPCQSDADAKAQAERALAALTLSADDRVGVRATVERTLEAVRALERRFYAGEALPSPYAAPVRALAMSKASKDSRLAELLRRMAEEQFIRNHLTALSGRSSWAQSLDQPTLDYVRTLIAPQMCRVDESNTGWLKTELKAKGWFKISEYGEEGDRAAFLLIQHADRDPEFQAEVLAQLSVLKDQGETRGSSYAYLFDRVAVASNKPQRYATQGRCTATGIWTPRPYEDPEQVDERRRSVGLMPLEEYKALFKDLCQSGPFS